MKTFTRSFERHQAKIANMLYKQNKQNIAANVTRATKFFSGVSHMSTCVCSWLELFKLSSTKKKMDVVIAE